MELARRVEELRAVLLLLSILSVEDVSVALPLLTTVIVISLKVVALVLVNVVVGLEVGALGFFWRRGD